MLWFVFSFDVIIISSSNDFVNTFLIFFQNFSFIISLNFIYCVIYSYFYKNSDSFNMASHFPGKEKTPPEMILSFPAMLLFIPHICSYSKFCFSSYYLIIYLIRLPAVIVNKTALKDNLSLIVCKFS